MTPDEIVEQLGLRPHPEGGMYAQTWRDESGGRGHGTAIYFLLRAGEVSRWHRVDATEIWHHYGGAPVELRTSADGVQVDVRLVGLALDRGERPQAIVPAGCWQSARSRGEWSLVGCTVSPGFVFEGFELAPEGWEPGRDRK